MNDSIQPVFLPKLSQIGAMLIHLILGQQRLLDLLTTLPGPRRLDKYRNPSTELLQSASDILSTIISVIPKCFTENILPINAADPKIFEQCILDILENVVQITCIFLINSMKFFSSSDSTVCIIFMS